jgi:plastocyanin
MSIRSDLSPCHHVVIALCLLSAPGQSTGAAPAETGWGDLQVRFTLEGEPPAMKKLDLSSKPECSKLDLVDETLVVNAKGGIKNVFVWLVSEAKAVHPDLQAAVKKDVTIHVQDCRFEPRSTVVAVGQTVHFKNRDPFGHNTYWVPFEPDNSGNGNVLPAESSLSWTFSVPEGRPMPMVCAIHPWMKGYLHVVPNLYASVSNRDGLVTIAKLPAGKHTFCAWSERYLQGARIDGKDAGWKKGRFEAEIKVGEATRLDVTVAPEVILGKFQREK